MLRKNYCSPNCRTNVPIWRDILVQLSERFFIVFALIKDYKLYFLKEFRHVQTNFAHVQAEANIDEVSTSSTFSHHVDVIGQKHSQRISFLRQGGRNMGNEKQLMTERETTFKLPPGSWFIGVATAAIVWLPSCSHNRQPESCYAWKL